MFVFPYLKYLVWEPRFLSMASREPMPRYFFSRMPSEKKYSPGASLVAASREPIITEQGEKRRCAWLDLVWPQSICLENTGFSCLWMLLTPELWQHGQHSGSHHQQLLVHQNASRIPTPYRQPSPGVGRMPTLMGRRREQCEEMYTHLPFYQLLLLILK